MTYCAALDNRRVLPPFSPVGANEDGLFGAMLPLCSTGSFIGQVPVGVVHDPDRPDTVPTTYRPSATEIRLCDNVRWIVDTSPRPLSGEDDAEGFLALSTTFRAWSALRQTDFDRAISSLASEARRRLLVACESALSDPYDYPPEWRAALTSYRAAVMQAGAGGHIVPVELQTLAQDQACEALRTYVAHWADALAIWPALWELARDGGLDIAGAPE
jgi:hypothetical protein